MRTTIIITAIIGLASANQLRNNNLLRARQDEEVS